MAILDVLVIAVIGISMLVGIMRGFMYEVAMIFGWVLAFFVAKFLAPQLSEAFANAVPHAGWRMGAAFSVIFIAVLFANSILAFSLKSIFSKSALRPMDRLLGSLFGVLRAGVVLLVVALVIHILRLQDEPWWAEAKTAPVLNETIALARPHLRSILNLDDEELSEGAQLLNGVDVLSDDEERKPAGGAEQSAEQNGAPDPFEREKALVEMLRSRQQ